MPEFVRTPKFEEYREQFKDYFIMERKNGIILLRMHTKGESVVMNKAAHNAWAQIWHVVGNDPENEVMILTGTGSHWMAGKEGEAPDGTVVEGNFHYDKSYYDSLKLVEDLIFDIHFPTIAAINGPGWQYVMALLCDITICSEDVRFLDRHFAQGGFVPGDGQGMVMQNLLGTKRAAYHLLTGKSFDAKTAVELGYVNEVVPAEKLMDRAWEIAEAIMKQPRTTRRLTAEVIRRPWKRLIVNDLDMHMAHEMYGIRLYGKDKVSMVKPDYDLSRH